MVLRLTSKHRRKVELTVEQWRRLDPDEWLRDHDPDAWKRSELTSAIWSNDPESQTLKQLVDEKLVDCIRWRPPEPCRVGLGEYARKRLCRFARAKREVLARAILTVLARRSEETTLIFGRTWTGKRGRGGRYQVFDDDGTPSVFVPSEDFTHAELVYWFRKEVINEANQATRARLRGLPRGPNGDPRFPSCVADRTRLSPQERAIVDLDKASPGQSYRQLAARLHTSSKAVKTTLSRIRRKLRARATAKPIPAPLPAPRLRRRS